MSQEPTDIDSLEKGNKHILHGMMLQIMCDKIASHPADLLQSKNISNFISTLLSLKSKSNIDHSSIIN